MLQLEFVYLNLRIKCRSDNAVRAWETIVGFYKYFETEQLLFQLAMTLVVSCPKYS